MDKPFLLQTRQCILARIKIWDAYAMKAREHGVQAVCCSARSLPVHHVFQAGEHPDIPPAFVQIDLCCVGMDHGPMDQVFQ
jgi:hypothetical protein